MEELARSTRVGVSAGKGVNLGISLQGDLEPQHHLGPLCSPTLSFSADGSLCFPLTGCCPSRGCLSLPALGTTLCPCARGPWQVHTSNKEAVPGSLPFRKERLEGMALAPASHPPINQGPSPAPREWVQLREVVS